MSSKTWASIALSAVQLSGCGTSEAIMASASIATFVQTDKTMTDHVVSFIYDEDCSILYTQDGGDYCRDETYGQEDERVTQQTYCYQTIGGIDCYVEEDPRSSSNQLVN